MIGILILHTQSSTETRNSLEQSPSSSFQCWSPSSSLQVSVYDDRSSVELVPRKMSAPAAGVLSAALPKRSDLYSERGNLAEMSILSTENMNMNGAKYLSLMTAALFSEGVRTTNPKGIGYHQATARIHATMQGRFSIEQHHQGLWPMKAFFWWASDCLSARKRHSVEFGRTTRRCQNGGISLQRRQGVERKRTCRSKWAKEV